MQKTILVSLVVLLVFVRSFASAQEAQQEPDPTGQMESIVLNADLFAVELEVAVVFEMDCFFLVETPVSPCNDDNADVRRLLSEHAVESAVADTIRTRAEELLQGLKANAETVYRERVRFNQGYATIGMKWWGGETTSEDEPSGEEEAAPEAGRPE